MVPTRSGVITPHPRPSDRPPPQPPPYEAFVTKAASTALLFPPALDRTWRGEGYCTYFVSPRGGHLFCNPTPSTLARSSPARWEGWGGSTSILIFAGPLNVTLTIITLDMLKKNQNGIRKILFQNVRKSY